MSKELRWKQRFENFQKAFAVFERRANEYQLHPTEEAYQLSMVQAFEFVLEMSWKTLKDYLELQGYSDVKTPVQVVRQAFQSELIMNGETWLEALKIRSETSHVYDLDVLKKVISFTGTVFPAVVRALHKKLEQLL